VLNALNVILDLLGYLHCTVYINLVKRVALDPLLLQRLLDAQLSSKLVVEKEDLLLNKYAVEQILCVKNAKERGKKKALIK